ncbi:hypothetical protein O0L34_g18386 [Tuta absoluta]|nr:hypothetical protein O0L34_g18386 [Tuta absoluta]
MRKISKSRVDDADDVVSSTNGSVNEDHADDASKHSDVEENKSQDSDYAANDDDKDDDAPLNSSKKSKGKGKGRPKKKSKKAEKEKQDEEGEDEEAEYEVEKIIDSKKIKGRLHYLIRWKGYSADTDSWEPENTLSCQDLINKFNEEKENSKEKSGTKKGKKVNKRKSSSKKESKSPAKRPKNEWDSEKADENAEYEVERILEVHHKKNGKREFLIHWKGWSNKFDSWEPESNLNCSDLIKKFMEKVDAAKGSDTRNLRVAPETTNRFTLQAPSSGRRLSKRRGQTQRVRYDDAE